MSSRSLLSLFMRLAGLALGIQSLSYAGLIGWNHVLLRSPAPQQTNSWIAGLQIFGLLTCFLTAWVLLRRADWLAAKLAPADERFALNLQHLPEQQDLFRFLLKVIGVVCVALSVPSILGPSLHLLASPHSLQGMIWDRVVPGAISLGVGLYLLCDGRAFVHLAYGEKKEALGLE